MDGGHLAPPEIVCAPSMRAFPQGTVIYGTYLGGQGDLISRIMGIIGVTIWVIGVINLLTKSPCPHK